MARLGNFQHPIEWSQIRTPPGCSNTTWDFYFVKLADPHQQIEVMYAAKFGQALSTFNSVVYYQRQLAPKDYGEFVTWLRNQFEDYQHVIFEPLGNEGVIQVTGREKQND